MRRTRKTEGLAQYAILDDERNIVAYRETMQQADALARQLSESDSIEFYGTYSTFFAGGDAIASYQPEWDRSC